MSSLRYMAQVSLVSGAVALGGGGCAAPETFSSDQEALVSSEDQGQSEEQTATADQLLSGGERIGEVRQLGKGRRPGTHGGFHGGFHGGGFGGGGGGGGGGSECAALQDGNYCGGDMVHGNSNRLYTCYLGKKYPHERCKFGCSVQELGTDDYCLEEGEEEQ